MLKDGEKGVDDKSILVQVDSFQFLLLLIISQNFWFHKQFIWDVGKAPELINSYNYNRHTTKEQFFKGLFNNFLLTMIRDLCIHTKSCL